MVRVVATGLQIHSGSSDLTLDAYFQYSSELIVLGVRNLTLTQGAATMVENAHGVFVVKNDGLAGVASGNTAFGPASLSFNTTGTTVEAAVPFDGETFVIDFDSNASVVTVTAATDALDGWLARRRGEVTTLGILLDPIADKLLTSSAFIALVELDLAPAWMIVVIVGREFAVSGMRSVAAARGVVMAASHWGKLKTGSQVVAIVLLILTNTLERWGRFGFLGKAMLWLVLVAAVGSAADYFRKFLRAMDTWPSPQS